MPETYSSFNEKIMIRKEEHSLKSCVNVGISFQIFMANYHDVVGGNLLSFNTIEPFIVARTLRINPIGFHVGIYMRVELYGRKATLQEKSGEFYLYENST